MHLGGISKSVDKDGGCGRRGLLRHVEEVGARGKFYLDWSGIVWRWCCRADDHNEGSGDFISWSGLSSDTAIYYLSGTFEFLPVVMGIYFK